MIYLLALFGLAYAQQKKQCLANVLAGVPGKVFNACDDISKVNALEADIRACKVQLGNCDGGGEEGGKPSSGAAQALLVKYGAEQFNFAFTSESPLGAAFDAIHDLAIERMELDEDHDLMFDYELTIGGSKVYGKVENDQELEEAVNLATAMGKQILVLSVHKTTLSPTPAPLEPWGMVRNVLQIQSLVTDKSFNIADGRDNGTPNRRILDFAKLAPKTGDQATTMRLHYEDNLRAHNNGANCYWEFYIAGARCASGWIRGAMHSAGNQNNDHQTSTIIGLCDLDKTETGKKHRWNIHLYGNNRDCYTGWDPESRGFFMMEAKEVRVGMYGYHGLTDRNKVRGEDNMFPILGRQLAFKKKFDYTTMRLIYQDNFRVYNGGSCRWYLRVDDKICGETNKQYIAASIHTRSGDNDHRPQAFTGYCGGLKIGDHVLKAGVQGSNDCYTGWESSFYLEAEEVNTHGEGALHTFYQRSGNNADGRDNGNVNWRTMKFKKLEKNSLLRVLYSDVLRVHGHGKWCKWEIKMNNKPCGENMVGSFYVAASQDDHGPGQIVGYCIGLDAGDYTMTITVRGNAADCYTGWDRQSQGSFLMEVYEMPAQMVIGKSNGLE